MVELWEAADEAERHAVRAGASASGTLSPLLRERLVEWEFASSAPLAASHAIERVARAALASVVGLQSADYGNVQLLLEQDNVLEIVAQLGFDSEFLATFAQVRADDGSACGRSLRSQTPILIEDVDRDAEFAPFRAIAAKAGFRSVLSTPMISSSGAFVGVLSTHFARPGASGGRNTALTMAHMRRAADLIADLKGGPRAADWRSWDPR
jgi:GAF domain-containing protein